MESLSKEIKTKKRIVLDTDEDYHKKVKMFALKHDMTITDLIKNLLDDCIESKEKAH